MLAFFCNHRSSKEGNKEHKITKHLESSSTSTISELVIGPKITSRIDHLNHSFSDVDYLPMKSGCLAGPDQSSDSYLNPSRTDMSDGKKF